MNRFGNLYQQIISLDNLYLADKRARIGKKKNKDMIKFNLNFESLASYKGWLCHANTYNLSKKNI